MAGTVLVVSRSVLSATRHSTGRPSRVVTTRSSTNPGPGPRRQAQRPWRSERCLWKRARSPAQAAGHRRRPARHAPRRFGRSASPGNSTAGTDKHVRPPPAPPRPARAPHAIHAILGARFRRPLSLQVASLRSASGSTTAPCQTPRLGRGFAACRRHHDARPQMRITTRSHSRIHSLRTTARQTFELACKRSLIGQLFCCFPLSGINFFPPDACAKNRKCWARPGNVVNAGCLAGRFAPPIDGIARGPRQFPAVLVNATLAKRPRLLRIVYL